MNFFRKEKNSSNYPAKSFFAKQPLKLKNRANIVLMFLCASIILTATFVKTFVSAYEINTAAWTTTSTTGSLTEPSGLVVSTSTTGVTTINTTGTTVSGFAAGASTMFTPNIATTTPIIRYVIDGSGCPVSGTCSGRGTITINFTQPVTNPILNFQGFGMYTGQGANASRGTGVLTLASSAPGGANLSNTPGAGATNLSITGGTTVRATNANAATSCNGTDGNSIPPAAAAGCGSVTVQGTVTQLVFNMSIEQVIVGGSGINLAGAADTFGMSVTLRQDFADTPVSFNSTQAPANLMGDLKLGTTIDEDNATTANSTTSPNAVSAGADNNGTNGDGADEDAISTFPALLTTATSYSLTVPISGSSKAGIVCGWIDFNRNNAFVATERACTTFVAAATSVVLNWNSANSNAPSGLTAGNNYVRLRAGYTTSQIQTVDGTGLADSGEVEDYRISITVPAPNVGLLKSCSSPANCTTAAQIPGTDVTYNIQFTNTGGQSAQNMAIVDAIPANTDYKLGSATTNLGTTGLTILIEYSADYDALNPLAATWTYTPVGGGGGASAGYDRLVKAVRWRTTAGTLSNVSPNNTGNVTFVTKIR